jgi:hypothetical protein
MWKMSSFAEQLSKKESPTWRLSIFNIFYNAPGIIERNISTVGMTKFLNTGRNVSTSVCSDFDLEPNAKWNLWAGVN